MSADRFTEPSRDVFLPKLSNEELVRRGGEVVLADRQVDLAEQAAAAICEKG